MYYTDDAIATVDNSGYFDNASAQITVGDLILVVVVGDPATLTSAPTDVGLLVCVSNTGGVVNCSQDLLNATVTGQSE
jgi:hypothetical protein